MDPVGTPLITADVHNQYQPAATAQRQSILGSFLRSRTRGHSQSHPSPPQLQLQPSDVDNPPTSPGMAPQNPQSPPSPGPGGHRRRPAAAGGLQASLSHGFNAQSTGGAFSQILRRRRSANGALNSANQQAQSPAIQHPQPSEPPSNAVTPVLPPGTRPATTTPPNSNSRSHRIRLVPHLDSHRALHFDPISRDVREGDAPLRIGRFTDRSGMGIAALNAQNTNKLAFKSKVVSRAHAEVWCEAGGKFFIKDTKSSSGTFLNHMRLSAPNAESRPFPLKDGDVLQLGVDYQGGTEEIYKCVKMRVEVGREWQSQANAFNTTAMKQLKLLAAPAKSAITPGKQSGAAQKSGLSDCVICLFGVTVRQSLFIAPCSHVFHYKCIRPLLQQYHPGFSCPICRTFANLEEDVEVEIDNDANEEDDVGGSGAETDAKEVNMVGTTFNHLPPAVASVAISGVGSVSQGEAMDVDGAASGNASAVESEIDPDFAPAPPRGAAANASIRTAVGTLRGNGNGPLGAAVRRDFEPLTEDMDERNDSLGRGYESDVHHPLPPLPGQSPHRLMPSGSHTASNAGAGSSLLRPMSAPGIRGLGVPFGVAATAVAMDDVSDEAEFDDDRSHDADDIDDMYGSAGRHDAEASGSSGEGLGAGSSGGNGQVGTGAKRKR